MSHTPDREMTVAVLMGGVGDEREVSLQSGECVADALEAEGVDVVRSDIRPDYLDILDNGDVDVFFIALHGRFGEDGGLQQIMQDRGLCYTGCGPEASAAAFDKISSKKAFSSAGVATAEWVELLDGTDPESLGEALLQWPGKYVVKPARQGSSVGVSIVEDADSAVRVAAETFALYGDCVIERFVKGREITVGVLTGRTLPIIEIRSSTDFYDYQAKYVDNGTQYLFDTIDDSELVAGINAAAMKCFESLGCRHFSRVDFIIGEDGVSYALEVNTIPGFTTHSLLPKAAARVGLELGPLCLEIVNAALAERQSGQAAQECI